jgi:hypothetical protein
MNTFFKKVFLLAYIIVQGGFILMIPCMCTVCFEQAHPLCYVPLIPDPPPHFSNGFFRIFSKIPVRDGIIQGGSCTDPFISLHQQLFK